MLHAYYACSRSLSSLSYINNFNYTKYPSTKTIMAARRRLGLSFLFKPIYLNLVFKEDLARYLPNFKIIKGGNDCNMWSGDVESID